MIKKAGTKGQWRVSPYLGLLTVILSGCITTPEPLKTRDVRNRVQADQFRIYAAQEPVFEPVSFDEALARSLKYNLDLRLKLMETAQNSGLSDLANFDMLPNLLVSAGYTRRNNISGSYSYNVITATNTTNDPDTPSYTGSQERVRSLASAEFTWTALDFGIGYFRSKQAANELLIAEERRRRVVQNILSDVRSAYWRALGAQRLIEKADQLSVKVKSALRGSQAAESQGLVPPKRALTYQRLLLDAVDLLASRRTELDLAKRELAALMNITPGLEFSVKEIREPDLKPVPINVAELEELALQFRPELRQEDYKVRITADEARKQLLYLLPNPSTTLGLNYDSNRYLYKVNWLDAAVNVNFNLFKILSLGAMNRAQSSQKDVDDTRRMALSIAVLTQVRVAIERYKLSLKELDVANESSLVDQRMAAFAEAAGSSQMNAVLETIRAQTRALNSEFKRYSAYAAAQAAFGRIYNSVGFEVVPDDLDETKPLKEVGKAITSYIKRIEANQFAHASVIAPPIPEFRLKVSGVSENLSRIILSNIDKVFERNRLKTNPEAKHQVRIKLTLNKPKKGVLPAFWKVDVTNGEGRVLGRKIYSSTLTLKPSDRIIKSFAEAAIIANIGAIREWLQSPQE